LSRQDDIWAALFDDRILVYNSADNDRIIGRSRIANNEIISRP